ncbi:uncharacterized protein A4U43_C05F8910 [Asparagus officinalis]|uniref:Uncharacterized protein n=1 Tax=Asparagus officinalis TaxID=4686 RepID=A0A5P1EQK4_ASPOF|nr:uncharacterized protein A4U43_C05F8910 [Asparagus officinalis]
MEGGVPALTYEMEQHQHSVSWPKSFPAFQLNHKYFIMRGKLTYQTAKKRAKGPRCHVTGKRIQGSLVSEVCIVKSATSLMLPCEKKGLAEVMHNEALAK